MSAPLAILMVVTGSTNELAGSVSPMEPKQQPEACASGTSPRAGDPESKGDVLLLSAHPVCSCKSKAWARPEKSTTVVSSMVNRRRTTGTLAAP